MPSLPVWGLYWWWQDGSSHAAERINPECNGESKKLRILNKATLAWFQTQKISQLELFLSGLIDYFLKTIVKWTSAQVSAWRMYLYKSGAMSKHQNWALSPDPDSFPHYEIRPDEATHHNLSDLLSSSEFVGGGLHACICSAPTVVCSVNDLRAARLGGVHRWQVLNASS